MSKVVLENHFDVPPGYAAQWLTDLRPDDAARYFDGKAGVQVRRQGNQVHSEGPHVMGWIKGTMTLDSPTAWRAENDFSKAPGGKVFMHGSIRESVRPEGQGTLHRVEIGITPHTLGMKLMFAAMGRAMMTRSLRSGFAKAKAEMEAAYRAGKPATS